MSSIVTSVSLDEASERELNILAQELHTRYRNRSEVMRAAIRAMYVAHTSKKQSRRKATTKGPRK